MNSVLEEKYKNQIVKFSRGDSIFRENENTTDLYIVLEGQIKIFSKKGDVIIPLNIINSGSVFGEFSFFDGKPRSACAIAATDAKLIKIERATKKEDLKKVPMWLQPVITTIIERLRQTDDILKRNNVVDSLLDSQFKGLEG